MDLEEEKGGGQPPPLEVESNPPSQEKGLVLAVAHPPQPRPVRPTPMLATTHPAGVGPEQQLQAADSHQSSSACVLDWDWNQKYGVCPRWQTVWQAIKRAQKNASVAWPQGYQIHHGKLYWDGKLCVPTGVCREVIKSHHVQTGHLGVKRLMQEIQRRYHMGITISLTKLCQEVKSSCLVCQACDPPNFRVKAEVQFAPIPPRIMDSVSIDIISLPSVPES